MLVEYTHGTPQNIMMVVSILSNFTNSLALRKRRKSIVISRGGNSPPSALFYTTQVIYIRKNTADAAFGVVKERLFAVFVFRVLLLIQ